jgi:hypothetical protein
VHPGFTANFLCSASTSLTERSPDGCAKRPGIRSPASDGSLSCAITGKRLRPWISLPCLRSHSISSTAFSLSVTTADAFYISTWHLIPQATGSFRNCGKHSPSNPPRPICSWTGTEYTGWRSLPRFGLWRYTPFAPRFKAPGKTGSRNTGRTGQAFGETQVGP